MAKLLSIYTGCVWPRSAKLLAVKTHDLTFIALDVATFNILKRKPVPPSQSARRILATYLDI